jgi:uncharacterized membrane protein YccC
VNANISLLLGVAVTGLVCGVVRTFGAEWIARRVVRSNWTTLAAIAESRGRQDRAALASVMLHRLASLAARLAVLPEDTRKEAANLRPLRVGLNIIDLRRARPGLSRRTLEQIDDMLARLASDCRAHTDGPLPYDLVTSLDMAIAATLKEPAGDARNAALMRLIGVRCGLFSDAPAFQPREPDRGEVQKGPVSQIGQGGLNPRATDPLVPPLTSLVADGAGAKPPRDNVMSGRLAA